MKLKKYLTLLLFSLVGVGCTSIDTSSNAVSKNQTGYWIKSGVFDAKGYISYISKNQGVVRKDETGMYLNRFAQGQDKGCFAGASTESFLRSQISGGKGILLPIYVGDKDGSVKMDVYLTSHIHSVLSQKGFNLIPINHMHDIDKRLRRFYGRKDASPPPAVLGMLFNPGMIFNYGPYEKGVSAVFEGLDASYLIDINGGYRGGMLMSLFNQERAARKESHITNQLMYGGYSLDFISLDVLRNQSNDSVWGGLGVGLFSNSMDSYLGRYKSHYDHEISKNKYQEFIKTDLPLLLSECIVALELTRSIRTQSLDK